MMKRLLMIVALMTSAAAVMALNMNNDETVKRIDQIFGAVYNNPNEPGAAVLIMQGNDTVYSRCFGLADMVTREPVTFATNFCIASVSKQFSAVALLQLAEEGKAPWTVCLGVVAGSLPFEDGTSRDMRMNSYDLFDREYGDFLVYELIPHIIREYARRYPQIIKPVFQKENQYSLKKQDLDHK